MSNVLEFDIDPEIVMDESKTKGMPDLILGNLRAMLTLGAEKYDCHWTELTWEVKIDKRSKQPYILVRKAA